MADARTSTAPFVEDEHAHDKGLARGGFFHSDEMRVVERFTRQGNEILYEVTVEDPLVLVEPFVMTPRIMRLTPGANAGLLPERGNCETSTRPRPSRPRSGTRDLIT